MLLYRDAVSDYDWTGEQMESVRDFCNTLTWTVATTTNQTLSFFLINCWDPLPGFVIESVCFKNSPSVSQCGGWTIRADKYQTSNHLEMYSDSVLAVQDIIINIQPHIVTCMCSHELCTETFFSFKKCDRMFLKLRSSFVKVWRYIEHASGQIQNNFFKTIRLNITLIRLFFCSFFPNNDL